MSTRVKNCTNFTAGIKIEFSPDKRLYVGYRTLLWYRGVNCSTTAFHQKKYENAVNNGMCRPKIYYYYKIRKKKPVAHYNLIPIVFAKVKSNLRWLANKLYTRSLAGKLENFLYTGWFLLAGRFLILLARWRTSKLGAGWKFYKLKVLLAGSEERVFFSQES